LTESVKEGEVEKVLQVNLLAYNPKATVVPSDIIAVVDASVHSGHAETFSHF